MPHRYHRFAVDRAILPHQHDLEAKALAATAGLPRIRVVEAQAARQSLLYDIERSALNVGQAFGVDCNAYAAAVEDPIAVLHGIGGG